MSTLAVLPIKSFDEAKQRLVPGVSPVFALGFFAGEVLPGGGVVVGAGDRDRVKRPVELAVAAGVEPVLGSLSGGGGDHQGVDDRGVVELPTGWVVAHRGHVR